MNNKTYIPSIYLVLYSLFKEKSVQNLIIFSDIREIMNRRLYSFPRKIHYIILEEMCDHKIIFKVDRSTYRLNCNLVEQQLKKSNINLIE